MKLRNNPVESPIEDVLGEWIDYNGHMNLAFYIHLFDSSWEVLLEKFNIGENSAKNEKRTTFAVESHTTYDMEVKVNDQVDMNLIFLDFDKKRLQFWRISIILDQDLS